MTDAIQLAVPVRQVAVAALSLDGTWSRGHLFLKLLAGGHGGPETVQDRLNDPDLFLPLQIPGERAITLLNKAQTVCLVVPAEEPSDAVTEDLEHPAGRIEPVVLTMAPGHQLSGWLCIVAPAWRCRLSDYLNTLGGAFFPLYAEDALRLINKHFVLRVQPQAQEGPRGANR